MDDDRRTDLVIWIADSLDASIDDVWRQVRNMPDSALIALAEQPSSLPLYIKSSETP